MEKDAALIGTFGSTVKVSSSDTAQYLPGSVTQDLVDVDLNDFSIGIFITVEDYPVRIAWRTAPTTTGLGHLLSVGDCVRFKGRNNILKMRFINKTAGQNGTLQITAEYDK